MFKFKKAITICVDKEWNIELQHFVDEHLDVIGMENICLIDDKVYIGFETRTSINKVAALIREKLYKTDTNIIGGTIFVKFY